MKATTLLRISAQFLLLTAAIVLILGEPYEDSASWGTDFLLQKTAGFACLWLFRCISRNPDTEQPSKTD